MLVWWYWWSRCCCHAPPLFPTNTGWLWMACLPHLPVVAAAAATMVLASTSPLGVSLSLMNFPCIFFQRVCFYLGLISSGLGDGQHGKLLIHHPPRVKSHSRSIDFFMVVYKDGDLKLSQTLFSCRYHCSFRKHILFSSKITFLMHQSHEVVHCFQ